MRLFDVIPEDRKMDRQTWRALDRASRALGREYEGEIAKSAKNFLLYGVSGFRVNNDGEIRAATFEEILCAPLT
jgi:hypothetical protein